MSLRLCPKALAVLALSIKRTETDISNPNRCMTDACSDLHASSAKDGAAGVKQGRAEAKEVKAIPSRPPPQVPQKPPPLPDKKDHREIERSALSSHMGTAMRAHFRTTHCALHLKNIQMLQCWPSDMPFSSTVMPDYSSKSNSVFCCLHIYQE